MLVWCTTSGVLFCRLMQRRLALVPAFAVVAVSVSVGSVYCCTAALWPWCWCFEPSAVPTVW